MCRYKHVVTDVNEPVTVTFRATQTTTHIVLESGWNVAVDNVYAVRAAEDVSSNNGQLNPGASSFSVNGQQLHKGFVARNTIGRTPAATGSEIVLYDFSSAGYLEQPYNHQLNFLENTGNSYTAMAWGSTIGGATWKPLIARDYWNGSKQWYLGVHDRMALHGGVVGDTEIEAGQLYFFCWVRNGSTGTNYVYLNGELDGSNSDGGGGAAGRQTLVIGGRHANSQTSENTGGSITDNNRWTGAALVRISQGYTDADMIRRIYNEERKLFMTNAKCTLDRDSNLIRGVSYDKSTGLLHVLSNNTRNDFDGLVRINSVARNSSGTLGNRPISSAKGMIVEES